MEVFKDFSFDLPKEDFFSTGTLIGECGVLTGRPRAAGVTCETEIEAYFISMKVMKDAMELFNDPYDSLEGRLWRSCGIMRGLSYLPTTGLNKVRLYL